MGTGMIGRRRGILAKSVKHMLVLISVLISLTVAAILFTVRVRAGSDMAELGRMSDQWLAEYRASHP
jgi:hypothetical protein